MNVRRNIENKKLLYRFCYFLFIVALFPFVFCNCGESKKLKKKTIIPIEVVVDVKATKALRRSIEVKLDVVGSFEAITEITLVPQVSGKVEKVNVSMGDPVSSGQLLVKLDPTDYNLQLKLDRANLKQELARLGLKSTKDKLRNITDAPEVKKAKAIMDNARSNWKRNIRMRKEDLISNKDVEDSLKEYKTAKADYEKALEDVSQIKASISSKQASLDIDYQKLKYTNLYSPVTGYVKERKVEPGDFLQAGSEALILVVDNPIYLAVDIPENFIDRVSLGQEIDITTDAVKKIRFHGKVIQISPVVNPETRTVTIKAKIENSKHILKPGMFSRVEMITGSIPDAVLVPKEALLEQLGITKIFVIKKDKGYLKAYEKKVEKGEMVGDLIQIKGDIKPGDLVAISSIASLVDGVRVKVSD